MQLNYYDILQVTPNASNDEIRKAYRKLALLYHPDKNPGNAPTQLFFQQIKEAYEVLIHPARRDAYHYFLRKNGQDHTKRTALTVEGLITRARDQKDYLIQRNYNVAADTLFFELEQLMQSAHLELLMRDANEGELTAFRDYILFCVRNFDATQVKLVVSKLQTLSRESKDWNLALKQFQQNAIAGYLWNKYKVLVAVALALALCITIFSASIN